ncbi:hypothetical protein GF367_01475 [Candidatus Woesearchaeota archaeon]|nr:hypothetical protein [Candidatus Woesearchaeota archaeon]
MMKAYIVALALVGLLVLSGCSDGGDETASNWDTFIGGTQGVSLRFETEAPPTEVNVGDQFNAVVILENQGEYTVPAGEYKVRLKGFSPAEFSTTSDALEWTTAESDADGEVLQGSEMNPDTGETIEPYPVYVTLPHDGMLVYTGSIAGNTPFPFLAELCYRYETTANAKLCIKDDLTKASDTKVCTISGAQDITSSGAPVQITAFKEFSGGKDAVRFSFTIIAASTGGEVSIKDEDTPASCGKSRNDQDKLFVTVETGIPGLQCNGFISGPEDSDDDSFEEGYIKLSGGSRQVTCTQNVDEDLKGDYVKIVTITAAYDYEQSVSSNVLVKQIS